MAKYIDFINDFNNDVLDELNLLIDKEKVIIDLEYFKNLGFIKEIRDLIDLNIIDRKTKILNKTKYQIFRKFIKSETINGINANSIKQLTKQLEKEYIDYKQIINRLSTYGFKEEDIDLNYRFQTNNEVQIRALIMIFGKPLYDKLSKNVPIINNEIKENNVVIFKGRFLYGKNNKAEVTGFQKKLCEYIFVNDEISVYKGRDAEEYIYGGEVVGNKLKSLITQINKKLENIGYKNIKISFKDYEIYRDFSIYI